MGAECSRCGHDMYDECGWCNLRDERDSARACNDEALRQLDRLREALEEAQARAHNLLGSSRLTSSGRHAVLNICEAISDALVAPSEGNEGPHGR